MDLFPYAPRPHQVELVSAIAASARSQSHLAVESGTGTGKTICALAGTLRTAREKGKKVIYLTRTNSQQRQVMLELRNINNLRPVFGIGLQGRQSTCPLIQRDPELRSGSPEELSKLCAERKARSRQGKEGGCRFYDAVLSTDIKDIEHHCRENLPTVEEFVAFCDEKGLCPHELTKDLLPQATVVTAPYAYFFMPFIRHNLLDWMNIPMSDAIVVVDEAHNLPDYAREIRSVSLSSRLLELVRKEVDDYGDIEIAEGISALDLLQQCEKRLQEALDEFLIEDDGLIPPPFLEEGLMSAFKTPSTGLVSMAKSLMAFGEAIREDKRKKGRLPRSYIYSLGGFMQFWLDLDEECYVKLVTGGENPSFEAYCMDPSLACRAVLECHSSVHMSGTLQPLNEYRDSIGLPRSSPMLTLPSPFPPENRQVLFLEDVTTRYEDIVKDEEIITRMEDYTVSLCNVLDRNTVVFFPSYALMDRFIGDGILHRIRRKVHLEKRGMAQNDLMEEVGKFKACEEGAVLFAVMGGRISEGIDFPDRELEAAIVAGIPYPKPTAKQRALLHYYEIKFGRGWEYTVKAPVTRKLLQAIGRLIRTETDVGVAVVLDRRANQFSDRMDVVSSEFVVNDVLNFFVRHGR
ncbi:MAG: ATP-dependent DNA helicase [Methanomassiliicoccus sp.]|nr:ATP-dependent DNA helicase [Methanomassiliicoccus sp.]